MIKLDKKTKIGWIGTGVMGKSMCSQLMQAGYTCYLFNRTKSKTDELVRKGAIWLDTPREICQYADIIFTMVGFPEDVNMVYYDMDGLFEGIDEGKVLVDMTTTKPSLAEQIAADALEKNAFAIDAPVSGGDVGARNGTLSIMIGGDKKIVDEMMPLFQCMGKNIIYQGEAGKGQHTKMTNQVTIAGTMIGVCEALLYGYKAGLNLETMLQSISKGAAGCWSLDNLAPRIIQNDFEPGFYAEHFIKDMGIALEEAGKMNLSLPGLGLVKQLYESVKANGWEKKGTQALYLAIAQMSGMN